MRKILTSLLGTYISLCCLAQNPPITPAWAFGHIVWEDNLNSTEGAEIIVGGYLARGFPVDGVIIDSPWSTSYNDFNWDKERYADPEGLIGWMRERNVKVILWMTGCVNSQSKDTRIQKSSNYDEMVSSGFGVNHSTPYKWWKGTGLHLDFTNLDAVEWWNKQLDKVFVDGVYGWKVDQGEEYLGQTVETSKGQMGKKAFAKYYYDSMFDYTVSRKPEAVTIARPYSHQGGCAASVQKMNLGWCGDFSGDWSGLKKQINNIYMSSQAGYSAVSTEVGGFYGKQSTGEQLVRYAQFGAMTACMINGGENGAFTAHLPWHHGEDVARAYSSCVELHEQLRPYMFSTVVEGHLHGGTLIRGCSFDEESHRLGDNIFTKALTADGGKARFHLPSDGTWIDFWTGKEYAPGTLVERQYDLRHFPMFFKSGSITPLSLPDNKVQLLIYPNGKTTQLLHLPSGEGTDYYDVLVSFDEKSGNVSVESAKDCTFSVVVKGKGKPKRLTVSNQTKTKS